MPGARQQGDQRVVRLALLGGGGDHDLEGDAAIGFGDQPDEAVRRAARREPDAHADAVARGDEG